MPKMKGAQALVRQLRSEGVEAVFALPGVQIMAAFDALYEARDDIRLIHTRHEQATTYMADGYAKVTGRVGVAMVVPGPGALNAASGLGTAYASSSPVLLISGQIASASLGRREGQLHEVEDQLDVFRPITKWNHRVTRVEEIPGAVHEAFRHLKTGRPRPVELEIPPDTLAREGEADIIEPEEYPRARGSAADIQRAAQLLAGAKRPAIIAGGGALISGAGRELQELAEFLQAPIMLTQQSKGVIPEDSPYIAGVNYAGLGPAYSVVPESDAVLAVGTRFLIRGLRIPDSTKVIHIDADHTEFGKNFPTQLGIEADAKEGLSQLLQQLRSTISPKPPRLEEIEGYKRRFADEMRALAPRQLGIIDTIRDALPDDAIHISGMTTMGYWSHIAYPVMQPRTYVTSSYFGTLGYEYPTALGAKIAQPDKTVIATIGDGGFMYNVGELSTAVRYGINVVAIVFNNQAFGASRWDQTHQYGERFIGTDLHNPDFVMLAQSFGAVGMRTTPDGLGPGLREALRANKPVLLEVEVPNMMPPFQIVK
ncbi:MAG: thiamine pyrophosphate-dependent enzyme [Chloroflexi bacterium]|nr:thiamine pyrophosphate-dependent enzyme [Chloroflexota bacterium]